MRGSSSYQRTITSTQQNSTQQAEVGRSQAISSLLVILVPIVIVCAIVSYRKYKATVMQQRIQCLNQLWQLDSSKRLP